MSDVEEAMEALGVVADAPIYTVVDLIDPVQFVLVDFDTPLIHWVPAQNLDKQTHKLATRERAQIAKASVDYSYPDKPGISGPRGRFVVATMAEARKIALEKGWIS